MLQECRKIHCPSYRETCCLRHLIEMNNHAEMQIMTNKYAKLLLKTLNHLYKKGSISFLNLKLDFAKSFLDIMSKYISHYYFLNKFEYSKLLAKIANKACEETPFREHPEVIIRACAINNNVACVYERTGALKKSLKYIHYAKKLATCGIDKAILHNNIIRICLMMNRIEEAEESIKPLYNALKDEVSIVRKEKLYKSGNTVATTEQSLWSREMKEKNEVLSFLYYNYANALEIIKKDKEALDAYKKGYEFSLCMLGEFHFTTNKFISKIGKNEKGVALSRFAPADLDEKDSDLDYNDISINKNHYNTDNAFSSKVANTIPKTREKSANANEFSKKKQNESLSSIETEELNKKLEMILSQLKQLDEKFAQSPLEAGENSKTSSKPTGPAFSTDNIRKILEPGLRSILSGESIIVKQQTTLKKPSKENIQIEMLDQYVKEFEEEERLEKLGKNKTTSTISLGSVENSNSNSNSQFPSNKNSRNLGTMPKASNTIDCAINTQNKSSSQFPGESTAANAKNPPKIKKLFERVLGARKEVETKPKGLFHGMVESLMNDSPSSSNSNSKYKSRVPMSVANELDEGDTKIEITASKSNSNNIIVLEDLESKPDVNAKFNNIKVHLDETEIPYEFVPYYVPDPNAKLSKPKTKQEIPKPRQFVFVSSEASDSDSFNYSPNECIDLPNKELDNPPVLKDNLVKEMNKMRIQVAIDSAQDTYEANTFYVKANTLGNPKKNLQSSSRGDLRASSVQIVVEEFGCEDQEIIQDEKPFDTHYSDSNIYLLKLKNFVDQNIYFESLIKSYKPTGRVFSTLRIIENSAYRIVVKGESNSSGTLGLSLKLFNPSDDESQPISKVFLEFTKLQGFISKILIYNALPRIYDLYQITTIDAFIERIFIFHCSVVKKGEKFTFGISQKPNGICSDRHIEFKFLKTHCQIDIIVMDNREVRIFIYNAKNDAICLQVDCTLDEDSFQDFLEEMHYKPKSDKETHIKAYKFQEKHITKTGFITCMTKKIQEILKMKLKDNDDLTFDKAMQRLPRSIFKCNLCNMLSFIDLWVITYEWTLTLFVIDYYTLKKVQIKDEEVYITKSYNFNSKEFQQMFGCEMAQVMPLLSERDISILSYLILSSFSMTKALFGQSVFDSASVFDIKKQAPVCLYSNSFVMKATKPGNGFSTVSLDLMFFNRGCFFFKLTAYDPILNMEFTNILLPMLKVLLPDVPEYLAKITYNPTGEDILAQAIEDKMRMVFKDRRYLKRVLMKCLTSFLSSEKMFEMIGSSELLLCKFKEK